MLRTLLSLDCLCLPVLTADKIFLQTKQWPSTCCHRTQSHAGAGSNQGADSTKPEVPKNVEEVVDKNT